MKFTLMGNGIRFCVDSSQPTFFRFFFLILLFIGVTICPIFAQNNPLSLELISSSSEEAVYALTAGANGDPLSNVFELSFTIEIESDSADADVLLEESFSWLFTEDSTTFSREKLSEPEEAPRYLIHAVRQDSVERSGWGEVLRLTLKADGGIILLDDAIEKQAGIPVESSVESSFPVRLARDYVELGVLPVESQIEVYDLRGRIRGDWKVSPHSESQFLYFGRSLNSGIYLLRIRPEGSPEGLRRIWLE